MTPRQFDKSVSDAARKAKLTMHVTASYMRRESGIWTVHIGHLDLGNRRYHWHQPWDGILGPERLSEALTLLSGYCSQEALDIRAEGR